MKRLISAVFTGILALMLSIGSAFTHAAGRSTEEFIDEASAKGLAEIETAKIALKKSESQDVRKFAQMMIDDHTKANRKLKEIAQQKDLKVADEADLMNKAKAMILKLREGESFDEAYANNQVVAHEQTIELFRTYIREGEDQEVKAFAQETLPTLEMHLRDAQSLAAAHGENQRQQGSDSKSETQRQSGAAKSSGKHSSGAQAHS